MEYQRFMLRGEKECAALILANLYYATSPLSGKKKDLWESPWTLEEVQWAVVEEFIRERLPIPYTLTFFEAFQKLMT